MSPHAGMHTQLATTPKETLQVDEDSRMADVNDGTEGADSGERDARGGKYSEY